MKDATRMRENGVHNIHRLAVGDQYPARLPLSQREGAHYTFDANGQRLDLFYLCATADEARIVSKGEARLALAYEESVIFVLCSFGQLGWEDAVFSVHLVPEELRVQAVDPQQGGILEVRVVDTASGDIEAQRELELPSEFLFTLEQAIEQQLWAGWNGREEFEAAFAEIYRKYPTSEALLERALCMAVFDGQ